MKFLLTPLSIALASSTVSAAAPEGPAPVQAQTPDRLALARQFAERTVSADQYLAVIRAGARLAASEQLDEGEEPAVNDGVEWFVATAEPTIREQIPSLREAYAQVYAREFSAAELQQMVAFAETPAGRHYLWRSSAIDLDPQVLATQQTIGAAIMPAVERTRKKLCADKAAARVAAGDTKAKCPLSAPTPRAG